MPSSGVLDNLPILNFVRIYDSIRPEALFAVLAHRSSIDAVESAYGSRRLLHGRTRESVRSVSYDLWDAAAPERYDGRPACHGLRHDYPESLLNLDRHQERGRRPKEFALLRIIHRPNPSNPMIIEIRSNLLLEIPACAPLLDPVPSDEQPAAGLPGYRNRVMNAFDWFQATQEHEGRAL
jgi:hypothetical protein